MRRTGRGLVAALLAIATQADAVDCTDDAMIVFDGSGSMSEMGFNTLDEPRIFEARRAMRKVMPDLAVLRRLGLIVYGPGAEDSCASIDVRFAPRPNAAGPVVDAVDRLSPAGNTPLTEAVAEAARVLDYRSKAGAVVLVTDGEETCGGAPCQLAATLAAEALDLTVHVIGFRVRDPHFSWSGQDAPAAISPARCLADRTGGEYISAEDVDALVGALRVTLGCPIYGGLDPARD